MGEKIDGIIGYSFLSRYIIKINFDSLNIEVYHPGTIKYPINGFLLASFIYSFAHPALNHKRCKDRISANFYFDTGAGLCFLMSKQFEEDSAVLKKTESLYLYRCRDLEVKSR